MARGAPKLQPRLGEPVHPVVTEDKDDARQLLRINRNSRAAAFKPILIG
jgi:hypothetical protein